MKKTIFLCISVVIITAILATYMNWDAFKEDKGVYFSQELSLKELSQRNDVPIKEILHSLSHNDRAAWELSRTKPIKSLEINVDDVKDALHHIKEENTPIIDIVKYILWSVLITFVLKVVLTRKKIKRLRVIILLLSVFLFGILLGSTPNPMESIVKLFKMLNGMEETLKRYG